jgi:hypothetical protein
MRVPMLLAIVLLAGIAVATAQNPTPPQSSTTASNSTVTGCLKGSVNQYYVVEKNGIQHVLLSRGHDLSSYVGHWATISGKADINRDASSSSDGVGAREPVLRGGRCHRPGSLQEVDRA